jgi:hypothetical protein
VDCEYNRNGDHPKALDCLENKRTLLSDSDATTVYPDIIVHRRTRRENLLVIEAKRLGRNNAIDRKKLRAFMQDPEYRYQFAVLLTFVTTVPYGITFEQVKAEEK